MDRVQLNKYVFSRHLLKFLMRGHNGDVTVINRRYQKWLQQFYLSLNRCSNILQALLLNLFFPRAGSNKTINNNLLTLSIA
jgi:hypothetical protein